MKLSLTLLVGLLSGYVQAAPHYLTCKINEITVYSEYVCTPNSASDLVTWVRKLSRGKVNVLLRSPQTGAIYTYQVFSDCNDVVTNTQFVRGANERGMVASSKDGPFTREMSAYYNSFGFEVFCKVYPEGAWRPTRGAGEVRDELKMY